MTLLRLQPAGRLRPAASRLLTCDGGRTQGPPCDPQAFHSFNGLEPQVAADISAWIGERR